MIKALQKLLAIVGFLACINSQAQMGEYYGGIGEGEVYTKNLANLCEKLKGGEELVVFGSSELTHRHPFMIHNFLTEKLNLKTTSYGHAGFQSLSVYLLLMANKNCLNEKTKFVWLISPGWFDTNGTQVSSYIEFVKDDVIYKTMDEPDAVQMQRSYIAKNLKSFEKITKAQGWLLNNDNVSMKLGALRYAIYSAKMSDKGAKLDSSPTNEVPRPVDWRAESNAALDYERNLIGNNPFWVREDYFNKYLKNLSNGKVKYFTAKSSGDLKVGEELQSFKSVVRLLTDRSVKPVLVLQPLNPRVYSDFDVVEPIFNEINIFAKAERVSVFDMTKIKSEYGLMSDGMHLGAVGWMKINKFVGERVRK
jgi:D-alanine transfer protein